MLASFPSFSNQIIKILSNAKLENNSVDPEYIGSTINMINRRETSRFKDIEYDLSSLRKDSPINNLETLIIKRDNLPLYNEYLEFNKGKSSIINREMHQDIPIERFVVRSGNSVLGKFILQMPQNIHPFKVVRTDSGLTISMSEGGLSPNNGMKLIGEVNDITIPTIPQAQLQVKMVIYLDAVFTILLNKNEDGTHTQLERLQTMRIKNFNLDSSQNNLSYENSTRNNYSANFSIGKDFDVLIKNVKFKARIKTEIIDNKGTNGIVNYRSSGMAGIELGTYDLDLYSSYQGATYDLSSYIYNDYPKKQDDPLDDPEIDNVLGIYTIDTINRSRTGSPEDNYLDVKLYKEPIGGNPITYRSYRSRISELGNTKHGPERILRPVIEKEMYLSERDGESGFIESSLPPTLRMTSNYFYTLTRVWVTAKEIAEHPSKKEYNTLLITLGSKERREHLKFSKREGSKDTIDVSFYGDPDDFKYLLFIGKLKSYESIDGYYIDEFFENAVRNVEFKLIPVIEYTVKKSDGEIEKRYAGRERINSLDSILLNRPSEINFKSVVSGPKVATEMLPFKVSNIQKQLIGPLGSNDPEETLFIRLNKGDKLKSIDNIYLYHSLKLRLTFDDADDMSHSSTVKEEAIIPRLEDISPSYHNPMIVLDLNRVGGVPGPGPFNSSSNSPRDAGFIPRPIGPRPGEYSEM